MIPVMIVDDEALIRSLILRSVDWNELGFTVVAQAENSEEALQFAEEHTPRLAVVDINIPFINGLDLADRLKTLYPRMVIIILTGYEEFSYARRAIRIGVLNYLLKPIDPEELRSSLETARRVIVEEERSLYRRGQRDTGVQQEDPRGDFLRALLNRSGRLSPGDIANGFRLFGIEIDSRNILPVIIETRGEVLLTREMLQQVLDSFIRNTFKALELVCMKKNRWVLLGNLNAEPEKKPGESVLQAAGHLRRNISTELRFRCSLGIGSVASVPEELGEAYLHAGKALGERFYSGEDRVYVWQPEKDGNKESSSYRSPVDRNSLMVLLRSGSEDEITELIHELFEELRLQRPRRQYCEMALMDAVSVMIEFLDENSIGLSSMFRDGSDALAAVQSMESLPQMQAWLEKIVSQIFQRIRGNVSSRTRMIVQKAKAYIEGNHRDASLSLDKIADHISVTPSYISGVFKKQLGVSIISYLTDFRIRKAMELMDKDPLLSVGEVAEAVGYADAFYFSRVFRKQAGISPSAYSRGNRSPKKGKP